MVLRTVTLVAAFYAVGMANIRSVSATNRSFNIVVTASDENEIAQSDLLSLKEKIQDALTDGGSHTLEIKVESIAIRPGGTPATLRQLGGRDAIRLTVVKDGKEESVPITSRTEGLSDQSLRGRRGKLFAAVAAVLKNRNY